MSVYRVAVGEMAPELVPDSEDWTELARELKSLQPDVFVFNELPFGSWLAARDRFDADAWQQSIATHTAAIDALGELGVPWVVGTRPNERDGRRCNEGFVWSEATGAQAVHTKQHIPNSPGYRETTWTEPGQQCFELAQVGPLTVGVLICTDIMWSEHARAYGRAGAHLIAVPRAMPPGAQHSFDIALQMDAIVSGCYVASSNRRGRDSAGEPFEGRGCVIDPLGNTVAQTSLFQRVIVHEVDTDYVQWKKTVYPCNVN